MKHATVTWCPFSRWVSAVVADAGFLRSVYFTNNVLDTASWNLRKCVRVCIVGAPFSRLFNGRK